MLGGLPGCLDVVFIFDVTKKAGRGFEFSCVFAYACELLSSGAAAAGRSGEREPVHRRSGRSGESGSVRPPSSSSSMSRRRPAGVSSSLAFLPTRASFCRPELLLLVGRVNVSLFILASPARCDLPLHVSV